MDISKVLARLSETYFFTTMAREARRFAQTDYRRIFQNQFRNMQLDKKHLLRRAGLTTYSPVKTSIGSTLLFIGGAATGALIGLSLAPMRGQDFRKQVKSYGILGRRGLEQPQESAHA